MSKQWLSKDGFEPGKTVWIISTATGKATDVQVQAAVYTHPHNHSLAIVCWPGGREWKAGWTYRFKDYGWVHGEHVFATVDDAVESVPPATRK